MIQSGVDDAGQAGEVARETIAPISHYHRTHQHHHLICSIAFATTRLHDKIALGKLTAPGRTSGGWLAANDGPMRSTGVRTRTARPLDCTQSDEYTRIQLEYVFFAWELELKLTHISY